MLLLICSHLIVAQNFTVDTEIKKIDSLIKYNLFDIAQRKTDSLYKQLNSSRQQKKYNAQILEVRFRHALLLDRQDRSSVEPLQILLELIGKTEAEHLHSLSYRTYLMIALAYEKADHLELTNKYLNKAYRSYKANNLEALYSTYCIRRSSYYRFINELDSSLYYASKAKEYAARYDIENDLMDSYILLGAFSHRNKDYKKALEYSFPLLKYRLKTNDRNSVASVYNNISRNYLRLNDFPKALLYSDSAYAFYNELPLSYKYSLPELRFEIFDALNNTNSAYYYFKQYHNDFLLLSEQEEKLNIKKLEEQYQNDKKEAVIKRKNQQMIFVAGLLVVIIIATVLLARKNRKINSQNKVINKQVIELTKILEQKQVLLSELQHRVKNNLQHVISILEIQKESVDFNNIDELIRGNQNRIHSMALLHKKLNVTDNVNEVDLKRYITELSELVKDSYNDHKKKISLNVSCEIDKIFIEKALPLGLIIVELVSNSMKHAFLKRNVGIITIEITKAQAGTQLYYADNGDGFDFDETNEKGLGMEIIKGLIDQLSGTAVTKSKNGFELTVYFKSL